MDMNSRATRPAVFFVNGDVATLKPAGLRQLPKPPDPHL
jgi:hypothetical protein